MTSQLFGPDETVRRISLVKLSGEIVRSLVGIGRIAVDGEVHRPQHRPGGRIYFTLRDRAAQISVTCPGNRTKHCRVVAGERARVTGRLVYANERGQLLFEAEEVVPVGEGAVAAMLADARRRLAADGLLERPRRRLPVLPTAIGVVCGADAAVRADIESVVAARFPGYPLVFAEVTVSGPGAAEAIAGALGQLASRPDVDVVVLARGGGDATQLLPFSDEALCRAICASPVPVVSAVGHEGDRPLCDEVVDVRCGTPSIAAALVVPDRAELQAGLDRLLAEAARRAEERVVAGGRRLAAVDRDRAVRAGLDVAHRRLAHAADGLAYVHPGRQLAAAVRHLDAQRQQLEALSPRRVLERGYAVVRDAGGTVLRTARQAATGDVVSVELAEGRLSSRVEEVQP